MKGILTTLLVIASCSAASAQNKHSIYVDAGINRLGIAATYDRRLTKHFDIGLGANTYNLTQRNRLRISSAIYLDLRWSWVKGKSTFFYVCGYRGIP